MKWQRAAKNKSQQSHVEQPVKNSFGRALWSGKPFPLVCENYLNICIFKLGFNLVASGLADTPTLWRETKKLLFTHCSFYVKLGGLHLAGSQFKIYSLTPDVQELSWFQNILNRLAPAGSNWVVS